MSKRIAGLLGQPEHIVGKAIRDLEAKNGYPSHDARHIAENIQLLRKKLAELGLDPDDTTGEELYHALLAKFEADCRAFDVENGFHSVDFAAKAAKTKDYAESNFKFPQRWVLKTSAIKELLRAQPPKKLMKHLSYRSVESMLKRENTCRLLIEANLVESSLWKKQLSRSVYKLDSTAFELRDITVLTIESDLSEAVLLYNDDAGALAIMRSGLTEKLRFLGLVVLLKDFLDNLNGRHVPLKSSAVAWWNDLDGLLADLSGENISFSIKDTALNHANGFSYKDRQLQSGKSHFWHNLLSRYENQLAAEEDKFADLSGYLVMPKVPIRQPAFEYVEDF